MTYPSYGVVVLDFVVYRMVAEGAGVELLGEGEAGAAVACGEDVEGGALLDAEALVGAQYGVEHEGDHHHEDEIEPIPLPPIHQEEEEQHE